MTTIQQVFDRAWRAAERRSWEYGRLGRINPDDSLTITVPDRTNFYFVRLGITGEQGLTTAQNAYGVAARENLLVKMRRENGTLVIYEADATATSGDPEGGAGTWDVGVHALDGEYHTGTLAWASVNKTGSSLADLASRAHSALSGIGANDHHNQVHALVGGDHTASGLTTGHVVRASGATTFAWAQLQHSDLGGVSANQHHNQVHALVGGDHTASGLTTGHVVRASGATSFAWAQLQHGDLGGVSANQHHNQVHNIVGSDHTVTGSQWQVVGLSASNTLGLLNSSSDVGTTPGAALLRSTSAGGLTLGSLTTQGSVDILNGGDLTVGANIFFVDASLQSVGVNRAPDPQFDVDVAGALRARYLIGDAAIQLSDATLIAHFDGPMPVGVNFYGETTGHLGQTGVAIGGVTHPRGRFDKSVQIAEATTNQVTNGSFETNLTGWTSTTVGNTLTRTTEQARYGEYSMRVDFGSGTFAGVYTDAVAKDSGQTWSGSAWIYRTDDTTPLQIALYEGATLLASATVPAETGWVLATVTGTMTTNTDDLSLRIRKNDSAATATIYIDGVQLEQKSWATPYCDGSLGGYSASGVADGTGHSWAGTAHASAASRLAAGVRWADVAVNPKRMTIMAWFMLGDSAIKGAATFVRDTVWSLAYDGSNYYDLFVRYQDDKLRVRINGSGTETQTLDSAAVSVGVWHHVALTVDGTQMTMYLDGVATAAAATVTPPTGVTGTLRVGAYTDNANRLNGWVDDLIVVDAALDADKIRAIYESNAPVFAESSVHHFRATPQGLIWADEEGLWMRDVNGAAVVGFYGGAASTKSWGGFTLEKGDIAFGRYGAADGGWLLFDRDGVSSKPFLKLGYADVDTVAFDADGARVTGDLTMVSGSEIVVEAGRVVVYDGANRRSEIDSTYGFTSYAQDVATLPARIDEDRDYYGYTISVDSYDFDFARFTGNIYTTASQYVAEMFGVSNGPGADAGVRVMAYNQWVGYDNDGNPQFIALHGDELNQASIRAGQIFLSGAGTSQSGVTNKIVLDTGGGLTEIRQPGAIIGGTLTPSYHSNLLVARDDEAGVVMDSYDFSNTNTENTLVDYIGKLINVRYALRDTVQNVGVTGDFTLTKAGTDQTQDVTLGTVTVTFVLKADGRLRVKKTGANFTLVSIMGVMA